MESTELLQELLKEIKKQTSSQNSVVCCPGNPIVIDGITAADALDANDAMGKITKLAVPKAGIIYSATLWDPDDEGLEIDLEIFKAEITQIANDAAWALSDQDSLAFVTELAFAAFDDHGTSQTSELTNIGKAYTAPAGYFYIQAVARGAHNIAAGSSPRFQLQIIPVDLNWQER